MSKETGRTTREKLAFVTGTTILALGGLAACGGEQTGATPKSNETHATPTETAPPAACDQPGKEDIGLTVEDSFCEPATAEQLSFFVTAEKNGWIYADPLAVFEAQKSLDINTVDAPLKSNIESDMNSVEQGYGVRDFEYKKTVETLKQASEVFNLLVPTLNVLANDLVQYNPEIAPDKLDNISNLIGNKEDKHTAFDVLITEPGYTSAIDKAGRSNFFDRINTLAGTLQPSQTIEFVKAATTPATKTENSTYFEKMDNVDTSMLSDRSLQLTGEVKIKITTYMTEPDAVETTEEYVDFLEPGEDLVLYQGDIGGDYVVGYDTARIGIRPSDESTAE